MYRQVLPSSVLVLAAQALVWQVLVFVATGYEVVMVRQLSPA